MEISTSYTGKIHVNDGQNAVGHFTLYVEIWDDAGLVQVGNGLKWIAPTEIKNVGDKHIAFAGDYEIEIRRIKPKLTSNNGVINLRKARQFKTKVSE